MAILQPAQLNPKNIATDPSQDITFIWETRGAPQTDFQVRIFDLNNSLLHDSTKITSSAESYTLTGGTLTNIGNVKWQVTTFNGLQSATSVSALLRFANNPITSFTNPNFSSPPVTIPGQEQEFELSYSQAQNIGLKSFRLVLYDGTGANVLQDTGELFAGDFNYEAKATIENLVRGESYQIQGSVTSEFNQTTNTNKESFSVAEYTIPDTTPDITAEANDSTGNITVNWADLKQVLGTVSGTSSYVNGKFNLGLKLEPSAVLEYTEPINQDDFSITWYHKFKYNFDGKMLTLQDDVGEIEIGYEDGRFYYIDTDAIKHQTDVITPFTLQGIANKIRTSYTPQELGQYALPRFVIGDQMETFYHYKDNTFVNISDDIIYNYMFITLTKDKLYIKLDTPLQTLAVDWDIDLKPTSSHNNLKIYGECLIDHLQVYNKQFTDAEIQNFDTEDETAFTSFTNYLARFENNLQAGTISIPEPVIGWRLRRRDIEANTTKIIAQQLPKSQLEYVDTFARNLETYEYSIFAVTANGEGLGQVSNEVSLNFWGFILTDGTTSFKFDRGFDGFESSAIETNKDYTEFETNSQFPVVYYATRRNYKKGSLTAVPFRLVGTSCDAITDRTTLEALESFINNEQSKFLKNTAGELYEVNTYDFTHNYPDKLDGIVHTISFRYTQTGEES